MPVTLVTIVTEHVPGPTGVMGKETGVDAAATSNSDGTVQVDVSLEVSNNVNVDGPFVPRQFVSPLHVVTVILVSATPVLQPLFKESVVADTTIVPCFMSITCMFEYEGKFW